MLKNYGQISYVWLIPLCLTLLFSGCSSNSPLEGTPKQPVSAAPHSPFSPQPFYYPSGKESFTTIAAKHKIDEGALRRFNPRIQKNIPPRNQRLRIPQSSQDVPKAGPYYYTIQKGDTLSNLAQHFHLALISLFQANPKIKPKKLSIGQRIVIPTSGRNKNNYRWPVDQPQIKIKFSWQRWGLHQGLALATKSRQEVFPIAPGLVIFAGEMRSFGKVVIVKHSNQQQSVYAYCHALFVEQNSYLSGHHPVCSAGKQRQIDKHGIYFELREAGLAIPPENYLPALPWPK